VVPVPVAVKVEKLNPTVEIIYADTTMLDHVGQEKTAVRFKVSEDGSVTDVYHGEKSLIQKWLRLKASPVLRMHKLLFKKLSRATPMAA
jgi:hypothetical protein